MNDIKTIGDWFFEIDSMLLKTHENKYTDTFDGYEDNKAVWFMFALLNGVIVSVDPTLSVNYEKENEDGSDGSSKKRVDL